jgi:peptidoglycan-N-acetylglucosamine deacetylase
MQIGGGTGPRPARDGSCRCRSLDGDPPRSRPPKPIIIPSVIRHLIAPHVPQAAAGLHIPRTLGNVTGVAITFDDGPHPEGTPAVLEILADADIKATFFLVGEQVERRPALAAEIAGQGHQVALHGYRHRPQPAMSQKAVQNDLERGVQAIQNATLAAVAWHRPPYGLYSSAGLSKVRSMGLKPLLWSRWGKDWRRVTTPERIAARATANLADGDVILLHDADFYSSRGSHERTVRALTLIVRELKRQKIGTVLPV